MKERDLKAFVSLALRHSCEVRWPTKDQIQACLTCLGPQPSDDDIAAVVAGIGVRRGENVIDLRRPLFQQRVAKLLADSRAVLDSLSSHGTTERVLS